MSTYAMGCENIIGIVEHHVTRLELQHRGGWNHNWFNIKK
jgi:hypothetical protein